MMRPPVDIEIEFICSKIVGDKFWKSGRKSKKWNWICLLVFVIATWANRENYTVNFQIFSIKIFKILNKKKLREKIFKRKKWSRSRLNWVGMRKENYEERKDWEVFKKLTGIFWPKMADFDRKWPKIGRVLANFRSSDIPLQWTKNTTKWPIRSAIKILNVR